MNGPRTDLRLVDYLFSDFSYCPTMTHTSRALRLALISVAWPRARHTTGAPQSAAHHAYSIDVVRHHSIFASLASTCFRATCPPYDLANTWHPFHQPLDLLSPLSVPSCQSILLCPQSRYSLALKPVTCDTAAPLRPLAYTRMARRLVTALTVCEKVCLQLARSLVS